MTSTDGQIPPGWYRDPERPGWSRWWDGYQWADYWEPEIPPAPPMPVVPQMHSAGAYSHHVAVPVKRSGNARTLTIVGAGLAVFALIAAGAIVLLRSNDSSESTLSTSDTRSGNDDNASSGGNGDADPSDEDSSRSSLLQTCRESTLLQVPGTDISVEPLSAQREIELGVEHRAIVEGEYAVANDSDSQDMLDDLLDDIAPADSPMPYSITLLDSSEVNAFALLGGSLYFTTGITDAMSKSELAFVMGHEVAHVECRHIAQHVEREALAAAALSALIGQEITSEDLYADESLAAITVIAGLTFSRSDESEADQASLDLLTAGGVSIDSAADALRVLQGLEAEVEPGTIDEFLSTHPPTQERIDALEAALADR